MVNKRVVYNIYKYFLSVNSMSTVELRGNTTKKWKYTIYRIY